MPQKTLASYLGNPNSGSVALLNLLFICIYKFPPTHFPLCHRAKRESEAAGIERFSSSPYLSQHSCDGVLTSLSRNRKVFRLNLSGMHRSEPALTSGNQRPFPGIWQTFSRDVFSKTALADKFLPLLQIQDMDTSAHEAETGAYFENLLSALHIDVRTTDSELSRIPSTGPVLVVCNRPFGILHAAVLGALIERVRPDVKILASSSRPLQGLARHFFCVDSFGGKKAQPRNAVALLRCVRWLQKGGVLVTCDRSTPTAIPWWRRRQSVLGSNAGALRPQDRRGGTSVLLPEKQHYGVASFRLTSARAASHQSPPRSSSQRIPRAERPLRLCASGPRNGSRSSKRSEE